MSDPSIPDAGEPDMTAAEYALGVLDGEERRAAAARLVTDPAFAAEVAAWEDRLSPLAAEVRMSEPSAQVWSRITAALGAPPGLWNNVVFWRGATVAGIAAAAASLVIVAGPISRQPPPIVNPQPTLMPVQVATLAAKPGEPASVVATLDPNSHELVLTPVSLKVTASQSPELWVIPDGQAPISLGVMDATKPYRIPVPMQMNGQGRTASQLVVTAEQLGGSPDKKPHGPAIAAGRFGQV
jgi:anti-sigma-K factor RskA